MPFDPHPSSAVTAAAMGCRPHCGACCIAPSISSPIPGMPVEGGISKPAGVRCLHLTPDMRCAIFGHPERPAVCGSLMPSPEMCGDSPAQALQWLGVLECETAPVRAAAGAAHARSDAPSLERAGAGRAAPPPSHTDREAGNLSSALPTAPATAAPGAASRPG